MRQWTVDAFASAPFRGNPACVVAPFDVWPDASWMQALAQENNQAETAFLVRGADPGRFALRWFTPTVEMPLCGHATLAAAHVLFAELGVGESTLVFETQSGPLTVARAGDAYRMDFPADPPERIETPAGLGAALGVEPVEVWVAGYLVAILNDEAAVRSVRPDLARLRVLGAEARHGPGNLAVAAPADPDRPYAVVSRFFAPGVGIPEDPTTGGAHCVLGPLFSDRLGRSELRFHQAFPGRGGDLTVETRGDRVFLTGQARTVIDSQLRL